MPESTRWTLVKASQTWGTQETVDYIAAAINKVHEQFPENRPPIFVGDISRKRRGYFPPHMNHQNGRDVDMGFNFREATPWYRNAYRSNLDLPRTWAFLRAIVTETDVELVYLDRNVIWMLLAYARSIGEDEAWLNRLFREPAPWHRRPLIRHENNHRSHFHIRFFNPKAQRLGNRMIPLLTKHGKIRAPIVFVEHKATPNDTLKTIVRRCRTSKGNVRFFNDMTSDKIVPGKVYKVATYGEIEQTDEPIVVRPASCRLPRRPQIRSPTPPAIDVAARIVVPGHPVHRDKPAEYRGAERGPYKEQWISLRPTHITSCFDAALRVWAALSPRKSTAS